MDSKAYQEGKLRHAPTTSYTTSNSTIRPLANKKSPVIQSAQRPPNLLHTTPFLSTFASSASSSSTTSTEPNTEVELSATSTEPKVEVGSMVFPIIYKKEEDEDMATILGVEYKERQCKRLSKSIIVIHPPTKKPYMKILCPKPVSTIKSTLTPSVVIAAVNPEFDGRPSFARGVVHLELGEPSTGPT